MKKKISQANLPVGQILCHHILNCDINTRSKFVSFGVSPIRLLKQQKNDAKPKEKCSTYAGFQDCIENQKAQDCLDKLIILQLCHSS